MGSKLSDRTTMQIPFKGLSFSDNGSFEASRSYTGTNFHKYGAGGSKPLFRWMRGSTYSYSLEEKNFDGPFGRTGGYTCAIDVVEQECSFRVMNR